MAWRMSNRTSFMMLNVMAALTGATLLGIMWSQSTGVLPRQLALSKPQERERDLVAATRAQLERGVQTDGQKARHD